MKVIALRSLIRALIKSVSSEASLPGPSSVRGVKRRV